MDVLREKLNYNSNNVSICMKQFPKQEHYEIIRLLLATGRHNVSICKHDCVNQYVDKLLSDLKVKISKCVKSTNDAQF
jgi:hypothetical protein